MHREDRATGARRAKQIGVGAFCLSLVLNDGLLTVTKIALTSLSGSGDPPGGPLPLTGDGWWISLIIAGFVGFVSYTNAEGDLSPSSSLFLPSKVGVSWWGSFWSPILVGVAVYHVAWLFQNIFGWSL